MDLILRTSSNQPEKNGDADYTIVRITPGLAQHTVERIEHLRQLKQQDSSLYKMVYSDNTPHFFQRAGKRLRSIQVPTFQVCE